MITKQTIIDLVEKGKEYNVSIYMPTHVMGDEIQQDPIRLKNLLKEAEEQLLEMDIRKSRAQEMLQPAADLLEKPNFWQHSDKGLAVFISDNYFETFRVPLSFRDQVYAGDHFLITPLLPMITLDGTFSILALSQKKVRLLRATRTTVQEREFENAPTSMEEFKQYDVHEKNLSSSPMPSGTRGDTNLHGWGDSAEENKDVENYLKQIENEVTSVLRRRYDPLILAGIDSVAGEYRRINHYSRLMEKHLSGGPDEKSNDTLRDEGWGVIKTHFLGDMFRDISRFKDLTGSDRQSDNLTNIVESTYYGKVDTLFVTTGEQSWGRFDEERDTVHHSAEKRNGENDLINAAAIKTLTQGGDVWSLDREQMPNQATVAAIHRYS